MAFGDLSAYLYIGIISLFIFSKLLLNISKTTDKKISWKIKGGTKMVVILASVIVASLAIPQVALETNPLASNSPRLELSA